MGESVEVVVSELDSAAARLADAGQRLQDGLSAVDLSVDELLAKGWKGGAATAYTAEWDKWHNGAGQVVRGLQSMSESLKAAGAQYAATDQQAAEGVGSSFQPTGGAPSGGAPNGSPSDSGASAAPSGHSAGGGAPSGQGGTGAMAEMMNLGQPAAQAGQALGQATGQLAAGLAQAAAGIAQAVTALAQQAAQADEKDDADQREASEERTDDAEDRDGDGATEQPGGADGPADQASSRAPVDAVPQSSPTAGVSTGVSRPSGAG